MSTVTIRANQNSYTFDQTGGTRDPQFVIQDRVAFMDAIEDQRTVILDTFKKGAAKTEDRPRWGLHAVTPRGSVLGATAAAGASSLTLPTGHSARFQQGHVLQVTRRSDNEVEFMWVNDDPGNDTLPVDRAVGSTALDFEAGDQIKIVGIAMPQGSDFPLAPVSRGTVYYNRWQEFSKSITHTLQSRKTPSVDNPNGDLLDEDFLQVGKDIKMDLDRALLFGRRRAGVADATAPKPSFMGGLLQMAELSGNVYNIGGSDILLTHEALEFVQNDLDEAVGDRAGTKYLMSWKTKQIFNRLKSPLSYNRGVEGTNVDPRWNSLTTDIGTIEFTHIRDFPDGVILVYSPKNLQYNPYAGADWAEKDFPTKGFYAWKGIGGIYTMTAKDIPGMALIRGFDTNLGHYPSFARPSTFLT
jgi:hypothetical protein